MKKLLTMILCVCMCLQLAACGGSKEDAAWVAEGAAMLDGDIRSGEFVLAGEVYSFPMPLQTWLDRGWHISNNYDNVDEFTLNPDESSTEFELFNEDGEYVRVSVYNDSDEEAKVEDCLVYSLYMSLTEKINIVFPGGMYSESKPAEILETYGEPDIKDDSEGSYIEAYYNYTNEDGWACQVNLGVVDNDYTIEPFSSIEYIITGSPEWTTFMENAGGVEGFTNYFNATMDASFRGIFDTYVSNGFDTQENAEMLYLSEMSYYVSGIMYYADVNEDYVDDATYLQYYDLAMQVLAKTNWEVVNVTMNDDGLTGTVELKLYPTDFLTLIYEDVEGAIEEFQTKYANVDFNSMSEEEYAACELDYAQMVLAAISGRVEETQTTEAITKTYSIDYDNGIISAEDWENIDDIIMGVAE
ncbi:MAG: hypothetical protein IJ405_06015 [Lachnospiraceae bacterium]|nr:hypothetical protein [Lachnospiraceae bacterium]MBQ7781563.1 hypothetical protein [Lachnospiraceae bacterium]